MCRALAYLGQPVLLDNLLYQPDSALVRQAHMPKMLNMLNLAAQMICGTTDSEWIYALIASQLDDPRPQAAGST